MRASSTFRTGTTSRVTRRFWARHAPFLVLARLGGATGLRRVAVSDPGRVAALALVRRDASELLIANLTADPVEISPEGWGRQARPSVIDLGSWNGSTAPQGWEAARWPDPGAGLRLGPFAI